MGEPAPRDPSKARRFVLGAPAAWTTMWLAISPVACTGVVEEAGAAHDYDAGHRGGAAGTGGSTGIAGSNVVGGSAGQSGGDTDSSAGQVEDAGVGTHDSTFADARTFFDGESTLPEGSVGPPVAMDCPGDPTQGLTEYMDTFNIEHPYNLQVSDRYTFIDGIHTFWIYPTDKPHEINNTTAPRTEARWSNFTSGHRVWSADVMVESPSTHTVIFQVHTTASGAGPVYLRIDRGNLYELDGSLVARDLYSKWFNLKVAFDAPASDAVIYINNCQKLTLRNSRPGSGTFYFKNGVYTCESSICRDHYKNIHLYMR